MVGRYHIAKPQVGSTEWYRLASQKLDAFVEESRSYREKLPWNVRIPGGSVLSKQEAIRLGIVIAGGLGLIVWKIIRTLNMEVNRSVFVDNLFLDEPDYPFPSPGTFVSWPINR